MASIELARPRIIAIEDRGHLYLLTLARVTKKQWLKYFEGIVSTSENQGGKQVDRFDSSSARLALVDELLLDAQGYTTVDGSPVTATPGWQQLLPPSHRLGAGDALVNVQRTELAESDPIMLGAEVVYLKAVWGADEQGVMRQYNGLCHSFKTPTAEQQHRYSRDSVRSVVVGGSRKAQTRWIGPQATLAELYDELIVGVEGYAVNGAELGTDRDAIIAEMDTYHKVAAADRLFSPAPADISDEAQ